MENRKTTIKELAKYANVSISTVSKALKDSPEISETTKKKIQKLAKIHQYTPNNLAVSFKSGRSRLIGVILPNLSKVLFSNILYGIEQKAKENTYKIIVSFSDNSKKIEKEITNQLFKSSIDGLIIIPCEKTIADSDFIHLNKIAENGIPTLLLSTENRAITLDVDKIENGSNLWYSKKNVTFQKSEPLNEVSQWIKQLQEFFSSKTMFSFSMPNSIVSEIADDSINNLTKFKPKDSFNKKRNLNLSKYINTNFIHPESEQNEINIGKSASQFIMNALTINV